MTKQSYASSATANTSFLDAYKAAFESCYHGKNISFSKGKGGTYHVVIDGDKGNITLTKEDIIEATGMLSR